MTPTQGWLFDNAAGSEHGLDCWHGQTNGLLWFSVYLSLRSLKTDRFFFFSIASHYLGVGELGMEEKLFGKVLFCSEKPIKVALCSVLLLSPLQIKSSNFHIADL